MPLKLSLCHELSVARGRLNSLIWQAFSALYRKLPEITTPDRVDHLTADEDETGIANLVVWPMVFEKYRRTVLAVGMMGVKGRIQREGEVVHLVAHELADFSGELASVGERDAAFPLPHGRGDNFHHGSPTLDPREAPPKAIRTRDIYVRDLHLDIIKVKTRDFR